MKLVIVDDTAINRKLLRVKLEAEGHSTIEAADGIEALQVLANEKVDGVISDILMPRMDGYRLCNEIRASEKLCDLPFVFYTSTFVSPVDEQMARDVGADSYLTKPASIETILAAVCDAVASKHGAPVPGALNEIEVLKVYSDRLVTKLEENNVELERELRMSALSIDVGAALMHGETLVDVLQRCTEALVRYLDLSAASIWTHNRRTGSLDWQAGTGVAAQVDERQFSVPLGQFRLGLIAEQRTPQVITGAARERCAPGQDRAPGEDLEAFAGYPLIVAGRLLGVIALFASAPFSEAALEKIASIADAIALGLDRHRSEAELRAALLEKTTLLQEVHHRVKNNLQVICSLLSMQVDCAEPKSSLGPLNDAHARVLAVSLIHEQIYQSETLSDLDFGEYIQRMSEYIFTAYCIDTSRIRLETDVEPVRVAMDHAVPCGLILNEFLSNVLKHAFKDGRVLLHKTVNGYVELTVADNGVGFPADFQWEQGRSLGMKVVHTLVRQLRGNLFVSGENGATFRFGWQLPDADSLPLPEFTQVARV